MAVKLIAPAGVGGIVQGRSGTVYTIAADGTISNVQSGDVDALMNAGFIWAVPRRAQYTTPGAPVAQGTAVIGASVSLVTGNTVSLTQPDMARQAVVVVNVGGGSTNTLTAGIVSLNYVANDSTTQIDNLNFGALLSGGTLTLSSSKGVEHLNSVTVVGPVAGGSAPVFVVGTNNMLAVPLEPGAVDFAVIKETKILFSVGTLGISVPSDETIGSIQTSTGMITPTTVPNGSNWLSFGYTYLMPG